jgi:hypothetical protein
MKGTHDLINSNGKKPDDPVAAKGALLPVPLKREELPRRRRRTDRCNRFRARRGAISPAFGENRAISA